jgi:hypothetical protein
LRVEILEGLGTLVELWMLGGNSELRDLGDLECLWGLGMLGDFGVGMLGEVGCLWDLGVGMIGGLGTLKVL